MKRVLIIGCPGSGKTTFARKFKEKTGIPLFYLDTIRHKADKTTISNEEFDEKLDVILNSEAWIIDGNYSRTMKKRIERCDTVFFFDLPVEDCIAGVEARIGKVREEMPWVEDEFDPEFRKFITDFPAERLPIIKSLLQSYADRIRIITFTSRAEADDYINNY